MSNFNLIELYQKSFGAIPYSKLNSDRHVDSLSTYNTLQAPDFKKDSDSHLGTPIFMPCTLIKKDKKGIVAPIEFRLPNEPLIEISGSKTIIKTAIEDNTNTFKELFSMNDYKIIIRGVIVQEDGTDNYPEVVVRKMRRFFEYHESVYITNDLMTIFGIEKIAIESVSFPAIEGAQSYQPYQIEAWSDEQFFAQKGKADVPID